uniref:Uncharacterized protein n=1 Tax=Panagrolaimus superbus TaxID=310955 RepID=A0A914Y9A7_9BILA
MSQTLKTLFFIALLFITNILMVTSADRKDDLNIRVKRGGTACSFACCLNPFSGCGKCKHSPGYTGSSQCGPNYMCTC